MKPLLANRVSFKLLQVFGLCAFWAGLIPTAIAQPTGGVPPLPEHLAGDSEFAAPASARPADPPTTEPQPTSADPNANSADSERIVGSRRLLEIVKNGGPLMVPIGLCSFVLLIFVFERAMALRKSRIIPGPFSRRFIEQLKEGELDRDLAIELCDKNGSPVADIFKAGAMKWGRPGVEVEQTIMDTGERIANEMRRYLRLINGISTVCPLLGLLGTVLGMIHAFDAIATASSAADPKTLIASGISQALLTTAAGMSVAIPAIIAYLFFVGRVDKRIMELDALGQQVVNHVSAEAQQTGRSSRSKKVA